MHVLSPSLLWSNHWLSSFAVFCLPNLHHKSRLQWSLLSVLSSNNGEGLSDSGSNLHNMICSVDVGIPAVFKALPTSLQIEVLKLNHLCQGAMCFFALLSFSSQPFPKEHRASLLPYFADALAGAGYQYGKTIGLLWPLVYLFVFISDEKLTCCYMQLFGNLLLRSLWFSLLFILSVSIPRGESKEAIKMQSICSYVLFCSYACCNQTDITAKWVNNRKHSTNVQSITHKQPFTEGAIALW